MTKLELVLKVTPSLYASSNIRGPSYIPGFVVRYGIIKGLSSRILKWDRPSYDNLMGVESARRL